MVDLIDRGKLIAEYDRVHVGEPGGARKLMVDAPRVDAEPVRHAQWIESPNIMECVVCSSCLSDDLSAQVVAPAPKWYRYCPICGARMDEEAKQ